MKGIADLLCPPSFLSPILEMGHRALYVLCMLSTVGLHSQPLYCTSIHSYLTKKEFLEDGGGKRGCVSCVS